MKHIQKILLLSQGFLISAFAMLSPIYAIFVERIGGGILAASSAAMIFSIATGIAVYIISRWEDSVKHQEKLLRLGYALSALGFLGYIFVKNVYHLFVVQVLLGLSVAVRSPAFDALYSKSLDHQKRASQWGNWETMAYLVSATAALVGGYIATNFGFKSLFMVMFICSLVALLFSLRKWKNPP
ncbi:MFS transporter [Candidatus Microgenomates bacterium]|nr:MFS transporter [Candidatus Microgenomates bacterium]